MDWQEDIMNHISCCFTGHRPEKLPWGINENSNNCIKVKEMIYQNIEYLIQAFGVKHFISGMARGIDMMAAEIVLQLKKHYPITLESAIPCEEQAINWPESDRERFYQIAAQADRETILQHHFTRNCYLKRNRYMVDHSGIILAVWDGTRSGTSYTINYARKKGRDIYVIDPVQLSKNTHMLFTANSRSD